MYDIQISAPVQSDEINALIDSTGDGKQINDFDWGDILSRSLAYVTVRTDDGVWLGFAIYHGMVVAMPSFMT